jgi:hypothetical protein
MGKKELIREIMIKSKEFFGFSQIDLFNKLYKSNIKIHIIKPT